MEFLLAAFNCSLLTVLARPGYFRDKPVAALVLGTISKLRHIPLSPLFSPHTGLNYAV